MSKPSHILVTGGAGFIGSHLVDRLLAEGRSVIVVDDCSTGSRDNLKAAAASGRLRLIESPLSTCGDLGALMEGAEAVYHLAAAVGVELVLQAPVRTLQTNLHETERVLETASRTRIPVILTSTSEVYGKSLRESFSEEDDLLLGPPHLLRWSYACSKLMDEFLALAYAREKGLPVVIARLFNTVGPRQSGRYGMVLPRFIDAAQTGAPLRVFGDGRQTRCFCYVGDTVEALVRLQRCEAARGQIFNIGSTEEVSVGELARQVIAILQSKSRIEMVPYEQAYAKGFEDMLRRRPVIDRLAQTVGFRPETSLRQIIERTAAAR